MKDHKDDGVINRDGITQGSGYGDTKVKTIDSEALSNTDDYERARAGEDDSEKERNTINQSPPHQDLPKGKT